LSAFTLLLALPVLVAVLLKTGVASWERWDESREVSWAALETMPKVEGRSGRILLVSYYSSSDTALYYAHYWANREGGRVVRRYGIEPYAFDMVDATPEQEAWFARSFPESMGYTGVGVIDLRSEEPRSAWWPGPVPGEGFESWLLKFLQGKGSQGGVR
jgi:hypothetical protein